MTVVDAPRSVFEALAGRSPAAEPATADPDLWAAIVERLNPARARPALRDSIETAHHTSVRGRPTVMLRSPDGPRSAYVRLHPDELALAERMDGSRTVATLVGEFARISGRLAPDQVVRVVADLGANRMLTELPVDAFAPVRGCRRRPLPRRIGHGLVAAARGRRFVLADPDRAVGWIYRHGGRLVFTRAAAVLLGLVAAAGLALFVRTWAGGADRLLLSGGSFALGGLVLLGCNVVALCCHELGHALGAKHSGRHVPAVGVLLYFGIPSAFVDTTDIWMAGRRARLLTTAAGPAAALAFAGVVQLIGIGVPGAGPLAFKLAFAWYLNTLFNLNPLMALDGYYLLMDWVEVPNLRTRAVGFLARSVRHRPRWRGLEREERFVALYAVLALLWVIVAFNLAVRTYRDRLTGAVAGLWHLGWSGRLVLLGLVVVLAAPVIHAGLTALVRVARRAGRVTRERRRRADEPRRAAALAATRLGALPPAALSSLSAAARWERPSPGSTVLTARGAVANVLAVIEGTLEGRRPGDPVGTVRARAAAGEVVGATAVLGAAPSALTWRADRALLLAVPAPAFLGAVPPPTGRTPAERDELETLLDETPSASGLSQDDRVGMVQSARALDLPPGRTAVLPAAADIAALVAAGHVRAGEHDARRGSLITTNADADEQLEARTSSRLWTVPCTPGLALLFPGPAVAPPAAGGAPLDGVHADEDYVPLLAPPAPPEPPADPDLDDEAVDRRLLAGVALLAVVIAIGALLLTVSTLREQSRPWVELPDASIVVTATQGPVAVTLDGAATSLATGEAVTATLGDLVQVPAGAGATLTFAGGSTAVLCPATDVSVGPVSRTDTRPVQPAAALALGRGRLVAAARPTTTFRAVQLDVLVGSRHVSNVGPATFAVDAGGALVGSGLVLVDGVASDRAGDPGCAAAPAVTGGGDGASVTSSPVRRERATTAMTPSTTAATTTTSTSTSTSTSTTTTSTTLPPTTVALAPPVETAAPTAPPAVGPPPPQDEPTGGPPPAVGQPPAPPPPVDDTVETPPPPEVTGRPQPPEVTSRPQPPPPPPTETTIRRVDTTLPPPAVIGPSRPPPDDPGRQP